jgi:uncharacterized membrane protein
MRFFGLDRRSWVEFWAWLPTSVAATLLPLEFALIGAIFKDQIVAHPLASVVMQLFVFVGGNLADNVLKEKEGADWFIEPPRHFPAQELIALFHVGLKLSVFLGTLQYVVFMTLLEQDLLNPGLIVSSSVTMLLITALYPTFYLGGVYLMLRGFPRMRVQISRFALPIRNVFMTPLASWMVYIYVAPFLR